MWPFTSKKVVEEVEEPEEKPTPITFDPRDNFETRAMNLIGYMGFCGWQNKFNGINLRLEKGLKIYADLDKEYVEFLKTNPTLPPYPLPDKTEKKCCAAKKKKQTNGETNA